VIVRRGVAVSVVIPCYNQAHFLPEAIASVHAQQSDGLLDCELIVVDDGSADDTSRIASGLGARVIRQVNRGLSAARNAGLAAARGDLIVFLDADDELTSDALMKGIPAFAERAQLSCLLRYCLLIDADGRPLPTQPPGVVRDDIYAELLHRNITWAPGAAIFRRADVVGAGGFPSHLSAAADYALYLRFARAGRLEYRHEPAVRYRQHSHNMSRDPLVMLSSTLGVLAAESRLLPVQYRDELAKGRRDWCDYYGDEIVDGLRFEWRGPRRPGRLARGVLGLIRHCPRVAARHATRKLRRVVRRLPPTQVEAGRFSPASGRTRDSRR